MILYRVSYIEFESNQQYYSGSNKFLLYTEDAFVAYFDTLHKECRPNKSMVIETFYTKYKTIKKIKEEYPNFEITGLPSYCQKPKIKRRLALSKSKTSTHRRTPRGSKKQGTEGSQLSSKVEKLPIA